MRITLDSSVLIAAHISRAGLCAELLEDLLTQHELATSEFILDELVRKLTNKFCYPAREGGQVVAFLRSVAVIVEPGELPLDLCRDPTDIPILGTAVSSQSALLISVDQDLLDLQLIYDIPIIRPGHYWRRTSAAD